MKCSIPALRLAAALAAFSLAGPASAHPPTILTAQGQQGVLEDVAAFRKALAAAIAGKDARIVSALAGDPVIENAPAEDVVLKLYAGGWMAVATGVSLIKSMADGKTYAVHWTVTYAKSGEDWQIVASHATRGKELTS